jgi:phosphoglycerate dehydrogenase-like enzyme
MSGSTRHTVTELDNPQQNDRRQHRVLVTSRSFSTGRRQLTEELADIGIEVVRGPADHDLQALAGVLATVDGWIAGTGPITDAHLALAPGLRIVARYGVGVDAVDLAAASRRGIVVTNTPGANSGAVADHTIALLLSALRDVAAGDRRVRDGSWTVQRTRELGGLTVGVIGFGRIGRGVAARLTGFGSRVLATDPFLSTAEIAAGGAEPADPDDIVRLSDVISLHTPGDQLIVDKAWLSRVRSGLVLVNTARADLIDEAALASSLRSGRVLRYAADTLSTEGGRRDRPQSPLLESDLADRVTITPHSAAQTVEAVDLMGGAAVTAIRSVLISHEQPPHLVAVREPA